MDDTIRRHVLLQVVLGDEKWSGSGFVINNGTNGSVQYVITTTSWMKNVLNIVCKDNDDSIQFDFVRDAVAFVYWQSAAQGKSFHRTKVSRFTISYLEDVHCILKELEHNSLNNWTCSNSSASSDELLYLSCVALFAVEGINDLSLSPIRYCDGTSLTLGEDIYIISTPFGSLYPQIFYNSISRGCVSSVYGKRELFLTDARCVPGSEGGMALIKTTRENYSLVGIIITNLVDNNDIPVNASLGITFSAFERTIRHCTNSLGDNILDPPITKNLSNPATVSSLSELVLPVSFGSSIGTGIIVSKHLILTCAHVVRRSLSGTIRYKGQHLPATVLYCAPNDTWHPDIAILAVKDEIDCFDNVLEQQQQYTKCCISDPVVSIGYTYQNPFTKDTNPSFSNGIISKLIPNNQRPVMIQTTSCIYQGMSGGLLCSIGTQLPLGLLVCVARDEISSFSYSSLSFVIPFSWMKSSIKEFIISRNSNVFSHLRDIDMWRFTENRRKLCCKI